MLEHQARHRADADLNLIPMIDILSVLVSFLLVYSTEVEVVQNSKGIEIPQSISEQRPNETVVVMLTRDEVFVQGEVVASIADVRASSDLIVAPLKAALTRKSLIGRKMSDKELADREVTVMADKSLPYQVVKKILSTCTDADYGKVSFALMQKDKPAELGKAKGS
jgi:biopolymer transport protein ExbD